MCFVYMGICIYVDASIDVFEVISTFHIEIYWVHWVLYLHL